MFPTERQKQNSSVYEGATLEKHGFVPTETHIVEASYKLAYWIAKDKNPHVIVETLIKPIL